MTTEERPVVAPLGAETVYDRNAQFYLDFVDRGLASASDGRGHWLSKLIALLGERFQDARVCDLCCGEGYAGRRMVECGAREVVGVDLSTRLIGAARLRAASPELSYIVDDARSLGSLRDGAFDIVVCHMAIHDVDDHRALFGAVRRIIRAGGSFAFSMLHPCFEAPFHWRREPPHLLATDGRPLGRVVRRYASEGYWNSGGDGMRGRIGAYHRKLSTYVNDLIASGFAIDKLDEPLADPTAPKGELAAEIPLYFVVAARAV